MPLKEYCVMIGGRPLIVFVAAVTLSACVSSGSRDSVSPKGSIRSALRICPGGGISNAPPTNDHGEVSRFTPIANISGVFLARAPVNACISSGFGPRRGGAGRFHYGLDLYTRSPSAIHAAGDGVIEEMKSQRGYGRTILIRHSGRVKTRYAHLSSYARGLRQGDHIRQGQVIGLTGESGNATAVHLHYEIIVNGKPRNPLTVGE